MTSPLPSPLPSPTSALTRAAAAPHASLRWLVGLRWASVLGQLATLAAATRLTEVPLHLTLILALIAAGAATNLALDRFARRPHLPTTAARTILAVLSLDVLLLTSLLLAAGGPMNPFSVFYLVHVVLGGLVLGTLGAWSMAILTIIAFGLLFFLPFAPIDPHAAHHSASSLHLQGMWVAYALAASFLAVFVSGLSRALSRRDAELARLRTRSERSERLAAISALSASAAHELGSPLTTIAITARELERYLDAPAHTASGALEDAQLIRAEVERCRGLLHELTQKGGVVSGEPPVALTTHALWRAVHARAERRPGLTLAPWAGPDVALTAPRAALIQALVNLVDNAHDAELRTGHPQAITTGTSHEGHDIRLWVRDQGPGFPAEILSELGEAFVTSRPGEGLGLGLHLAESLARALGGRLDVRSSTQGSEVTLILPETSPHE